MPSEQPNENMDKVLKAYAKKRREDSAQIEMDLPTRNMLQAEVKRTLGEVPVPAAARPRPRFAWWPQLIIGVASAAALAIALLVWKLPSHNETSDSVPVTTRSATPAISSDSLSYAAKAEPEAKDFKEEAIQSKDKAQVPAPALANEGKARDQIGQPVEQHQLEAEKKNEPAATVVIHNAAPTAPASVAVDAPAAAVLPTPGDHQSSSSVLNNSLALSPAPDRSIAAAAPAQIQTRSVKKVESAHLDQLDVAPAPQKQRIRFSQINNRAQYRVNLNSPPLPKVLTTFGLERTGTNVVIKDADGSVYAGRAFQNSVGQNRTQAFLINGAAQPANSPTVPTGDAIPADNFAFRVSGYNNKLRQKIVFSGNVINTVQNTNPSNALALSDQRVASQTQNSNIQQQLPAQNVLLNGRVQVGRNSEFDIEAAPVTK